MVEKHRAGIPRGEYSIPRHIRNEDGESHTETLLSQLSQCVLWTNDLLCISKKAERRYKEEIDRLNSPSQNKQSSCLFRLDWTTFPMLKKSSNRLVEFSPGKQAGQSLKLLII